MMTFSIQVNMSLSLMAYYGSFAIVVTLVLRLLLKRRPPKAVFPALWVLVMVRLLDDQVRGFGWTNPMGMVDVEILRDSTGGIAENITYHEGDAVYDKRTKNFPR